MKILLFTPAPPNKKNSGSIMLFDICNLVQKKDSIYCFVAGDPVRNFEKPNISQVVDYRFVKRLDEITSRLQKWFSNYHFVLNILSKIDTLYINKKIIKQVIAYGKKNKVDCVWAVLQGKTMISAALPIAKGIGVPLLTQVWDDPEWIFKSMNVAEKKVLLKIFNHTVEESSICATASEEMAINYRKKYKIRTVVFLGSLDQKMALLPGKYDEKSKEIKIGFAGQMYAQDEWQALIKALDSVNWHINDKRVTIYLLGNLLILKKFQKNIIALGYKTQKEVIKILGKTDILYLPYWFSSDYKIITKTSFPSKMATYLASGRLILFHGPTYATPTKFIRENKCGILCHSLKEKDIIRSIKSIISNPIKYNNITDAGNVIFEKSFTYKTLNKNLNVFLSVARKGK